MKWPWSKRSNREKRIIVKLDELNIELRATVSQWRGENLGLFHASHIPPGRSHGAYPDWGYKMADFFNLNAGEVMAKTRMVSSQLKRVRSKIWWNGLEMTQKNLVAETQAIINKIAQDLDVRITWNRSYMEDMRQKLERSTLSDKSIAIAAEGYILQLKKILETVVQILQSK